MKAHIIRLGSVGARGVTGPQTIAIDLIYSFLLQEFEQDVYNHIHINHIGDDLNELIIKEGRNDIHINIKFPMFEDFETRPIDEQNLIRLEIIHNGLLRISEFDKKLDISKLEAIRNKILEKNFSFDFICSTHEYKKGHLKAMVIVHPMNNQFDYYVLVEGNNKERCKVHIYTGLPASIYSYKDFFASGKWKSENEFMLTGKAKEMEINVLVNERTVNYINRSPYDKPPLFEMMRGNISELEREKAYQDWLHSLPPAHAAIIRQADN